MRLREIFEERLNALLCFHFDRLEKKLMALNDSVAALTAAFNTFKADLSAKLAQAAADLAALKAGTSDADQIAAIDAITQGLKDADAQVNAFDPAPAPAPAAPEPPAEPAAPAAS